MKNILIGFLMLLICSCCKRTAGTVQSKSPSSDTLITDPKLKEAVIINYTGVDGCGFLLELSGKEKLQPENLPAEFQKDKLKVLVKYHLTNKMTICMAGKTVYLDFIKIKKE